MWRRNEAELAAEAERERQRREEWFAFLVGVFVGALGLAALCAIVSWIAIEARQAPTSLRPSGSPCPLCGAASPLRSACVSDWGWGEDRSVGVADCASGAVWHGRPFVGCALGAPSWAPVPHLDRGCTSCGHVWIEPAAVSGG